MTVATPFSPQLIGETEKALNALLRRALADRLTEPQWVTLRVSLLLDGTLATNDALAAAVKARAHFEEARSLVSGLDDAGLVQDGRPTEAAHELVAMLQQEIRTLTRPIWEDLPAADVEAAGRVLNEVATRARAVLAA